MAGGIVTCPIVTPSVASTSTIDAELAAHVASLAAKNANGGMGLARLSVIHPCPRSIAMPTPNPINAAPMTPNAL
jgi:hypothetical protein